MAGMPGNIAKGPILEKFDAFINRKRKNLQDALAEYKDYSKNKNVSDIIKWAVNTPMDPAAPAGDHVLESIDQTHILKHWFSEYAPKVKVPPAGQDLPEPDPPYWRTKQPMGDVVRQGLILALERCDKDSTGSTRTQALPLDTYWLCAGTHFEVVVTVGHTVDAAGNPVDHHVNLLILTPSPPFSRHAGVFTGNEDIWVVTHSEIEPGSVPVGTPGHIVTARLRK